MMEMQVVFWRFPSSALPHDVGTVAPLAIETASVPGLYEKVNDGWRPLSHTIAQVGTDILLSILMVKDTDIPIPDDASTIGAS